MSISKATLQPSTSTVVIGMPAHSSLTGVLRTKNDIETEASIEEVMDERNEVVAEVISKRIYKVVIDGTAQSTAAFPAKGTTASLALVTADLPSGWPVSVASGVKWMVHSCKLESSPTITRFSIEFHLPINMVYT